MFSEEYQRIIFVTYADVDIKDVPEGLVLWEEEERCLAIAHSGKQSFYNFTYLSDHWQTDNKLGTFFTSDEDGLVFSYLPVEFLS